MKLDKIPFSHSLKNIPLHGNKALITSSIQKTESLIKRMRWKAFWFDRRDEENDQDMEENYGFKTHNTPPPHPLLKDFEEDLFKLVKNIKFRKVKNQFLSELGKFKKEVKNYKDVIVKADKTRNMYAMDKENYMKLLGENITKVYRKADEDHTKKINRECKEHAIDLKIEIKWKKSRREVPSYLSRTTKAISRTTSNADLSTLHETTSAKSHRLSLGRQLPP